MSKKGDKSSTLVVVVISVMGNPEVENLRFRLLNILNKRFLGESEIRNPEVSLIQAIRQIYDNN